MQIDMHFYGVYCLAIAAGINKSAAKTIAYASQYVDDSHITETVTHDNGSKVISVATAHHVMDIQNIDHDDQRYIWIPFHFFPGGEGEQFTEKLICRKDSAFVNEMLKNHIQKNDSYILELLGIALHVYADTFAHYGFSGISSRRNRVFGDSLKLHNMSSTIDQLLGKKVNDWFKKYGEQGGLLKNIRTLISEGAELATGALGHGGVSIYPDQPYLNWEFKYEYETSSLEQISIRNNQETFLEACLKIYQIFVDFLSFHPEYRENKTFIKIDEIIPHLKEIIATEGDKKTRIKIWQKYAEEGKLYNSMEKIPIYNSEQWHDQYEKFYKLTNPRTFVKLNIYKFFQAASYHKHYTLRELLPKHGIIVI